MNNTKTPDYKKLPYFKTTVGIAKTQGIIRKFLMKYNLKGIRITDYKEIGIIEFILEINGIEKGFRFEFILPLDQNYKKQTYRALFYYLKARFTSVDYGIRTIEQEFMPELILKLPDGSTTTIASEVNENIGLLETTKDLQLPFKLKQGEKL